MAVSAYGIGERRDRLYVVSGLPYSLQRSYECTVELADCKYFTTNLLDLDTIMVRNFSELDFFCRLYLYGRQGFHP